MHHGPVQRLLTSSMFPPALLSPPMCAAETFYLLVPAPGFAVGQGPWLQVAFLTYGRVCGQPWAPLLGWRRPWPQARWAQTPPVVVNQSHNCWATVIESFVSGSYQFFTCRGRAVAQSRLPEEPQRAALLRAPLHGERSSCRKPRGVSSCLSAGEQVVKGGILPQLLAVSSSPSFITHWAMLRSTSRYKAKWWQKNPGLKQSCGSCSSWMCKGNRLRKGRGAGVSSWKLECKIAVCLSSQWLQTCAPSQAFPPWWTPDSLNESPVSYRGGFSVEIFSI